MHRTVVGLSISTERPGMVNVTGALETEGEEVVQVAKNKEKKERKFLSHSLCTQ